MRTSTFLVAGSLAAVAQAAIDASILSQIPSCAQSALIQGFASSGCKVTDTDCICANTALISSLQQAVASDCSAADQATTLSLTADICPNLATSAASSAAAADAATSTAAITTDSSASTTAASDLSVGTGTSTLNSTAPTGTNTPPTTPTVSPSTGAAAVLRLDSMVVGIGAMGLVFVGL